MTRDGVCDRARRILACLRGSACQGTEQVSPLRVGAGRRLRSHGGVGVVGLHTPEGRHIAVFSTAECRVLHETMNQ